MARWGKWLPIVALTVGIWHNLALLALWWISSQRSWNLFVDFNSRGEALLEGLLAHFSLAIMFIALVVVVASVKSDKMAKRSGSAKSEDLESL